jgi:DNA-binding PadR family transcriptional regulator
MNDLFVLANLLDGPKHGYALKKQVGLISGKGEMHNNIVYPLLRRFVESGWVSKRQGPGERGQTRDVYALTNKGKQQLLRRLSQPADKEMASENGFRLRVGLFSVLDGETRGRILAERDQWLADREERLVRLSGALDLGAWGSEVVRFLREQIRSERKWIAHLKRKLGRHGT